MSRCRGWPTRDLSDMLVNASYHGYQEYVWFMGRALNHVQDNLKCYNEGMGMTLGVLVLHASWCILSNPSIMYSVYRMWSQSYLFKIRCNLHLYSRVKRNPKYVDKQVYSFIGSILSMGHYFLSNETIMHISQGFEGDITEYQSRGNTKALALSAFNIVWHNAPGLSCRRGADILVCHPRSHVVYV